MDIEEIGRLIVHCAIKVHSKLGPGLLEKVYQKCLAHELRKCGFKVDTELILPIYYDTEVIDAGFRLDMLVQDQVIVENKTVERMVPIYEAQLLTYLRMKELQLGYLLNWNVVRMKDGIRRMVNNI